jgi:uncharacterized membrane protein YdfJ with MMPL/SSD domain
MRAWLYRHRAAIITAYIILALTVVLVLQVLEAKGVIR